MFCSVLFKIIASSKVFNLAAEEAAAVEAAKVKAAAKDTEETEGKAKLKAAAKAKLKAKLKAEPKAKLKKKLKKKPDKDIQLKRWFLQQPLIMMTPRKLVKRETLRKHLRE